MSIEVDNIQSTQGFATLEEEWEELFRNAPRATPFQSWAWLYSWWEFYGEGYELRLMTIRHDGLLVGLVPLMLERGKGFRRLLFVGTGLTDYLDALAREGWEAQVAAAGAKALRMMGSWRVADLQQLRPDAVAWSIIDSWAGPRIHLWQDGCPIIAVKPWEELLSALSKKNRKMVRRTIRQAEADGIRRELASRADIEKATHRLVALHRELWHGRDIGPEHLTERFESLMVTAARRMMDRGIGGISEFWRDGEAIISDFFICKGDYFGMYVLGASQDALRHYQWSTLCIWDALNIALSKGGSQLDLLRGEEPYKLRWSSEVIPTHRLVLGRRWATWAPYAGYHLVYSRARRYIKSESAPQWVENAANSYRALRRGVIRHRRTSRPG